MTAGDLDSSVLGRVVRPADYVRVLATPMRLRSPHFAVHHLEGRPLPLKKPISRNAVPERVADAVATEESLAKSTDFPTGAPVTASLSTELSTGAVSRMGSVVDDSPFPMQIDASGEAKSGVSGLHRWLGLVVPKRHAKRAVTRTLVKRQIRNVVAECAPRLEPGLWVVRQRSPFDPKQYPSAASDALKEAARAELRALFERAVRGERDRLKPRGDKSATGAPAKGSRSGKPAKPAPPTVPAPAGQAVDRAADPVAGQAGATPAPQPPEGTPCTP